MMGDATAVKIAIGLLHVPSRARPMRSAALPDDVLILLEIAAGDAEAASRASALTGRTREVVRDAAAFFIEQILLAPDSDSYRVLGARPEASSSELRRNMALLLRWLHPDMEHNGKRNGSGNADRSLFAGRVTLAWDDLKTAERRAAYDAARSNRRGGGPGRGTARAHGKTGKPASQHHDGRSLVAKVGNYSGPNGARSPPSQRLWRALRTLLGVARP